MSKRRLPPATTAPGNLYGPSVKGFGVVSWCASLDSPASAVAINIELEEGYQLVCRIKSPQRVDELIQMLLRHKRDVWPDSP